MTLHHNRRAASSRFIPRAEPLEDRCCPAVNVFAFGRTLFILGDSSANTVTINDGGNGTVTATITGATNSDTDTFDNIRSIVVLTGAGADAVNYTLDAPLARLQALLVDLGRGADTANLDASAGVSSAALLATVLGGDDADTIEASIGTIAAGAYAGVALDGNRGADTVSATFDGELDGALALAVAGGPDGDTVSAVLDIDEGSTGYLASAVLGGGGDDTLTHTVNDDSGGGGDSTLEFQVSVLDGGDGTDTCVATDNVDVFNCEP